MSHHHRAASPLQFPVREIVQRPGAQAERSVVIPAPAVLGTDVIGVPEGSDLALHVRFESVSEGIWVHGSVEAVATGECGRCLDSVSLTISAPVQGLFVHPGAAEASEDEAEDVFEFDGDTIDLDEVVRDAVVTALPFTPLCRPDCPGLCDQCGARLADDPEHAHDAIDPRWSALGALATDESVTERQEN